MHFRIDIFINLTHNSYSRLIIRFICLPRAGDGAGSMISSAFPLVGASNVGGSLCRCDPLTQTLFVFRC